MPDRHTPRSPRMRMSLVSVASLVVVVGLSSSLGLARTVWGGPPAADETPAEAAPEEMPATDAGDDFMDVDPTAEPSSDLLPAANSTAPSDDAAAELLPPEARANVPAASSLRAQMEAGMAEIGELAVEARTDEDLVRATCVLDKQDRANDVMDLGTSELLIIRDPGTSEQARSFAIEKLDAAAGRIEKLVDEAKACSGRQGPEDEVDVTRNEADEPRTVPLWAPSAGLGASPVPPPMDGNWPPAASPIE